MYAKSLKENNIIIANNSKNKWGSLVDANADSISRKVADLVSGDIYGIKNLKNVKRLKVAMKNSREMKLKEHSKELKTQA